MPRKLIFMTTADPSTYPEKVWRAFHFADVAAHAGLQTEVRLVDEAVKSCRTSLVLGTERGARLIDKLNANERPYPISVCETSCAREHIDDADIRGIRAVLRTDEEILLDIADQLVELVHVG
ncbi:MAG: hypothetical protein LC775_13910 [Acidobacteria bacterium]|nr:hypothetical protein [Acidobacteriota bacterium]